jgi:hypothetical protein
MAGLRSRLAAIAGVTAIVASALVIPLASPASAYVAANTTGCDFGMFPVAAGGQSGFRVGCNFTSDKVTGVQVYHDFPTAVWHNGAAKTISASTTNGSKTITAANGRFSATADVNRTVSGPGIQPYTFITSVTNATTAVLSRNASATGTGVSLKVENSNARSIIDGVTASGLQRAGCRQVNLGHQYPAGRHDHLDRQLGPCQHQRGGHRHAERWCDDHHRFQPDRDLRS